MLAEGLSYEKVASPPPAQFPSAAAVPRTHRPPPRPRWEWTRGEWAEVERIANLPRERRREAADRFYLVVQRMYRRLGNDYDRDLVEAHEGLYVSLHEGELF